MDRIRKRNNDARRAVLRLLEAHADRSWDAREVGAALSQPVARAAQALFLLERQKLISRQALERIGSGGRAPFRYKFNPEPFDPAEISLAIGRMTAIGPFRPSIQGDQP